MEISGDALFDRAKVWTSDDFRLPETLACVPEEGRVVLDNCFKSISGLLDHSLRGLAAEGIPKFAGYGVLTGLSQNGMIRAGVETRADEMTRKWGRFTGPGGSDKLRILEKEAEKYGASEIMNRAAAYCGYYGGCLGFIDTGEAMDSLAYPLLLCPETFRQGSFRGIRLIEPYLATPANYNSVNPLAEDYFRPGVWYVQGIPVHGSRLLYFTENELPAIVRPAYNFFGLSLSQKAMDAVSHYTTCREAAARLLEKYALTVFKTDMTKFLSGRSEDVVMKRVKHFVKMRNNDGCAAIDKEKEDLVVMTTSLSGVTDLVRQAEEYVAAMFCEPVTKMWGLSPAGFNTGDSDLRNHYDNIESLQQKILYGPMARLTEVLQMNMFGEIDPDISFEFNPLSDEDENMKISTAKTRCDMNVAYMEAGVLSAEEVRRVLIDDPNSGFDALEDNIPPLPDCEEELELFVPDGYDEENEARKSPVNAPEDRLREIPGTWEGKTPEGAITVMTGAVTEKDPSRETEVTDGETSPEDPDGRTLKESAGNDFGE